MPSYGSDSHAGNRITCSFRRKAAASCAIASAALGSWARTTIGLSRTWASTAATKPWPGAGTSAARTGPLAASNRWNGPVADAVARTSAASTSSVVPLVAVALLSSVPRHEAKRP